MARDLPQAARLRNVALAIRRIIIAATLPT